MDGFGVMMVMMNNLKKSHVVYVAFLGFREPGMSGKLDEGRLFLGVLYDRWIIIKKTDSNFIVISFIQKSLVLH